MRRKHLVLGSGVLAAHFVSSAIACILFVRVGSPALLWSASAIMIATLGDRPLRAWWPFAIGFMVSAFLANGLFGLGWAYAPGATIADSAEGLIASFLFSRRTRNVEKIGSLVWLTAFVIPVAILAPVIVGSIVVSLSLYTQLLPLPMIFGIVIGHILGNITFAPIFLLIRRRGFGAFRIKRAHGWRSVRLLGLLGVVTAAVFVQSRLPLLFLLMLPLMLVSFRLGKPATMLGVLLVGAIGTALTLYGHGPIQMINAPLGEQMRFFQFYLACTVLLGLPIAADLEKRQRLHTAVRISEERYRLLAEHSTDILMQLDLDGLVQYISPSIHRVAGYRPEEVSGSGAFRLVHPESMAHVMKQHMAVLASAGDTHAFEYRALTASGEDRWFEAHARAICDPKGRPEGVLSIVRDITARKLVEQQLTEEALTDPLTGLFNRRGFERLVNAADESRSGDDDCIAIFDIDHFKRVNDSFGHEVGDAVLGTFARVIRDVMRGEDVIARTGGEEFAVLLRDTSVDEALAICDRLRLRMAAMETLCGGARVRVTVSGGVTRLGAHGLRRALKEADEALYRAKREGRDRMLIAA